MIYLPWIENGRMNEIAHSILRYITVVMQDGDYLNDWLTHMPSELATAIVIVGQYLAEGLGF